MTTDPAVEAPHADAASSALTVAFGDPGADVYGIARLGLADGRASGLVLLFAGGEPVAVHAEGGVELADPAPGSWDDVAAAGLDTTVVEPLAAWRLHFAGEDASFDLELRATGAIAELDPRDPVAKAGGMTGYEQPVRVTGTVTAGDRRIAIDGRGQRGHSWGAPDWDRIALARTVSAWLGDDLAISLTAIRPDAAGDHAAEHVSATVLQVVDGEPLATAVDDPRLSTTYDADGRQRKASLELWTEDERWPRRAVGEVVCGTSLDLGRLRLDCGFFRWRSEDREGFGRYDVLRKA